MTTTAQPSQSVQSTTPSQANQQSGKNRRRKKFILPELQFKIAVQMLFVTLPILLLNFLLTYTDALSYQRTLTPPSDAAVVKMSSMMFTDFLIALALAIPFSICVGILYSFPFCGPIYRFMKYLGEFVAGRWDRTCTLRQGDHLHDLNNSINTAIRVLTGQVYRQYELLRDARAALKETGAEDERMKALVAMIDAEQAEVASRFGEGKSPADRSATPANEVEAPNVQPL